MDNWASLSTNSHRGCGVECRNNCYRIFLAYYVIKEKGTSATRQRLSSKSDEGIEKSCNFRHHSKRIMAAAALRALRQSLPPSLLTHLVGDADAIAITARPTEYDLGRGEERRGVQLPIPPMMVASFFIMRDPSSCVRIRSRKSIPPLCIDLRPHTDDLLP